MKRKTLGFFAIAAFAAMATGRLEAAISISDGLPTPGEWNSDFKATFAEAKERHVPLVLVMGNAGCSHCDRLKQSFDSVAFSIWQADRKFFMVHVTSGVFGERSKNLSPATVHKFISFVPENPRMGTPRICVYWQRADGTEVGKMFPGRRGAMGGEEDPALAGEFASAVDNILAEYIASDTNGVHRKWADIVANGSKKISCMAEGAGTVVMNPSNGVLSEKVKIELTANASSPDSVFLEWELPDGRKIGHVPSLTVAGAMPEGVYKARFRSRSEIRPPVADIPATNVITRVGARFKIPINVDEASLPVSFALVEESANFGINPMTGVIHGKFPKVGTNVVSFVIKGNDPLRTTITNRITVVAEPRQKKRNRFKRD